MKLRRAVMPVVSAVVCLLVAVGSAIAQPRVAPTNRYERLLIIAPMTGAGTDADPRRPLHVPIPSQMTASLAQGTASAIIGYAMIESDDGKFALVEFVAHDRAAFQDILADNSIRAFLKGRDDLHVAEAEFQKLKKGFSIANFGLRMVQ